MLRRFAPKSLYARTILIVVLPIFLMQSVVTYIFFNRHWEEVTATLAESTASNLGLLTQLWAEADTPAAREMVIDRARTELSIDMAFFAGVRIPANDQRSVFDALNRVLDRELDWSLDVPYWYNTGGFDDEVEVRAQLSNGYLMFRVQRDRVVAQNGHFFVMWLIGATVLLGYVALVFLRNQVRSITRLAAAADAFGRGEDAETFKPSGAREVRLAGHAFIAMRARIRRFLEQRTEMLAGVSHDLKTPLTRMRLNLALQPETPDVADLKADVQEMERLLEDYLTFARGEATPREVFDLKDLAAEIARGAARQSHELQIYISDPMPISAQRRPLYRAITNLVENSFKFATEVRLSATATRDRIDIEVDDNGPGIPARDREAALRAFGRLGGAQRSDASGTGLGLAIVRDVARSHGGKLSLGTSVLGGLNAKISIPIGDPNSDDTEAADTLEP